MKANITIWIIIGALSLWLGVENFILYIPGLIFLYPLALVIIGRNSRNKLDALRFGWLLGLLGSSLGFYWLTIPMHYVGGLPWLLAFPCAVFIGSFFGFFCGLFSLASFLFRDLTIWQNSIMLGIVWYLTEWLRGWVFTGFPWLPFVMGVARYPSMLQGASVIGIYALSGLYVGISCLAFDSIVWYSSKRNSFGLKALFPFFIACALFLCIIIFGVIRLSLNPITTNTRNEVAIAIIQGNDDQLVKWSRETKYQSVKEYVKASENIFKNIQKNEYEEDIQLPQIILWPETVLPFDFQSIAEIDGREPLLTFAKKYQVPVIFGAPGVESIGTETKIFNRVYFYTPQAYFNTKDNPNQTELQWYDKEHLVPFGEYTPIFFNLSFLKQLLQSVGTYSPGERVQPIVVELRSASTTDEKSIHTNRISMGVLLCYEGIFPEIGRKRVANNAEVFVALSNDSWFGKTIAPQQHLQLAQMRTIEFHRWMARAAVTGISAFIDPYGRLISSTDIFVPAELIGTVTPLTDKTIFFWISPWLPGIVFVFFCIMLWRNNLIIPFKRISCFSYLN